ncbi:hypothetical protein QBC45DRAFT_51200 [Copromyces sp. CBS 386.78]|nr:hypothetical protein QBC45DRAFT_51200 [Copromyces sp. CBS 386.78]
MDQISVLVPGKIVGRRLTGVPFKLHMHRYPTSPSCHRMLRASQSGVIFGAGDLGATSTTLPSAVYMHLDKSHMYYIGHIDTSILPVLFVPNLALMLACIYITVAWVKSPGPRFSCAQVAKACLWALFSLVFAGLVP